MSNNIILNALGTDFNKGSTGVRRYSTEILKHIIQQAPDCTLWNDFLPIKHVNKLLKNEKGIGNYIRLLALQTIPFNHNSVFYSPTPEGSFWGKSKQVVTIHDILPIRYPEVYPRQNYYFKQLIPKILEKCQKIIVISEFTKNEMISVFNNLNPDNIIVVYPGYNKNIFNQISKPVEFPRTLNIQNDNFILTVAETRQYKNILGLIDALGLLKDIKLVVVGKLTGNIEEITSRIIKHKLTNRVIFTNYISDNQLAELYRRAKLMVFPSKYEGFGIPLLEAMACGCPVVSSNAASLPEVGGDAVEYFDPINIEEIAAKIMLFYESDELRINLRDKGLMRCSEFDYSGAAMQILTTLKSL